MKKEVVMSIIGLAGIFVLSACAHHHPVDGVQEKTEIPAGVRVRIGSQEIKDGDKLSVLKTTCIRVKATGPKGGSSSKECKNQKVGEAIVLKVLDHDSAIVQPQGNLQMDETMKVERQ